MRIATALIVALALAGCATDGEDHVEYRTVTVTKEVAKSCPVAIPARPAPVGKLPGGLEAIAALLGAKLKEYISPGGYADRAEAAIQTCKRAGQ